jgi:uncharacterized protein
MLVALRLGGRRDIKAIRSWIDSVPDAARRDVALKSLPSLPVGTAWLWSPGWLGELRRIRVRERRPWDSSSTPLVS